MMATLDILGKKYSGEGKTPVEAIGAIDFVGNPRGKALLSIGEKNVVLSAWQVARIVSKHPLTKNIAIKQLALRF